MTCKFKVGDRVVAIAPKKAEGKDTPIMVGERFTVSALHTFASDVYLEGKEWSVDTKRFELDTSATADKQSGYATIMELLQAAGGEGLTAKEIELRTGVKAHKRLPEMRGTEVKIKTCMRSDGTDEAVTRIINGRASRVWVLA